MTNADRPLAGQSIAIVGAGIGGLAAALRLSAAGASVTVVEAASAPGGKIRTQPSVAGPVDAGPTVLTLLPIFEELFAAAGEALADHVTLHKLPILARHYWRDGTRFDLMADVDETLRNLDQAFGPRAARDYAAFRDRAARLFDAFDAPMMRRSDPSVPTLALGVARQPRLLGDMAPGRTLAGLLARQFAEPRLAQLFGRYATYVGGSPYASPALLALISEAEARGVWAVSGGLSALAAAIESVARMAGATFLYDTRVERIALRDGRAAGIDTTAGHIAVDAVLFNGDPRALRTGLLGEAVRHAVPRQAVEPRSLSAHVLAFAAVPAGPDLAHHTVFFGDDPRAEFGPLAAGETPGDATLYLCAQDRLATAAPGGHERFEIIRNAPPVAERCHTESIREAYGCQTAIFDRLRAFGLTFDPPPGPLALTDPAKFAQRFPGSLGSLYGPSPHGIAAALRRPKARTAIPGLYLCGGGVHPGPGVPMATLSARHAAEAIVTDHISRSPSRRTAMPGGTWTGSRTTGPAGSRSSPS